MKQKNEKFNKIRLVVFRSSKYFYVQAVDDTVGKTLASVDKKTRPEEVGKEIAEKLLKKKITEVVFDRNGYRFHGNIKKLADAARESGLKF